jgi:hypothetical protein
MSIGRTQWPPRRDAAVEAQPPGSRACDFSTHNEQFKNLILLEIILELVSGVLSSAPK